MANSDFQMFITTLLMATPSTLNGLLINSASTPDDFAQDMTASQFHIDAINRAKADVFPNLDLPIPQPLLVGLRAQTTLKGVFGQMGAIIHTQLGALYGGSTIHPTTNEAKSLVGAAKLLDGVS